eukprot:scaffold8544_cov78-Phaeocystis_antarctica.AAC.2
MLRRAAARQPHLSALAGHAVHFYHTDRSAAWPDLADLFLTLHRSPCRSVLSDSDAFTSIYSSPQVSQTDALYTESPLGRLHRPVAHIERMRLFSVQYAPPTLGQPQCGRSADCHAHWLAPTKPMSA